MRSGLVHAYSIKPISFTYFVLFLLIMISACDDNKRRSIPFMDSSFIDPSTLDPPQNIDLSFDQFMSGDGSLLDQELSHTSDMELNMDQMSTHLELTPTCPTIDTLEIDVSHTLSSIQSLGTCQTPLIIFNVPRGSSWRIELSFIDQTDEEEDQTARLLVDIYDSLSWLSVLSTPYPLVQRRFDSLDSISLSFTPQRSGLHYAILRDFDSRQLWASTRERVFSVSLHCEMDCQLKSTRYPVILVHGYAGVDRYFGLVDYFYRVPQALREAGFSVFIPSLSPVELTETRAQELSDFLDEIQLESGAQQFNLIAHSQGGLDSRYLISTLNQGHRVASLTTIATPHRGIPIRLVDFFSAQDFSEMTLNHFNELNLDDPQVSYFSWSARTCTLLEPRCLREHNGEVVTPFLLPTYTLLNRYGPNDGLVPTNSMYHGQHLGELSADHFDQIGQIADRSEGPFPHLTFYLDEVLRLAQSGF